MTELELAAQESGPNAIPRPARLAHLPAWVGPGIILCALLFLILAINPVREFPVEDDWDYSKTVWNVLQTGTFYRLQVTQATVLFPALWGALWSTLFGYSLTVLRLATLVLSAGALLFFYALLGELEFDRSRRVLATLTLLLTPVFVYLAFSFMTDIPLFFGIVGALYLYVRAWKRNDLRLAVLASIFAALGFLARQVGALVPIAFALFVLIYGRGQPVAPWRWILAGTAFPLLVVGGFLVWSNFLGGANWADRSRTFSGTLGFWLQLDTAGVFVRRYAIATATLGIYILPVWLALVRGVPQAWASIRAIPRLLKLLIVLVASLSGIALLRAATRGEWFPYLTDILTRSGMRPYLAFFAEGAGATRPPLFPFEGSLLLTLIAGGIGILLSALIVARATHRISAPLGLVYLTTLVLALASLTFFTYFERYLLPLLPGVIVLVLDSSRRVRLALLAGTGGLVLAALVSIGLMQDYFAWNQVRWNIGNALIARGTLVEKIDGGYEWNGWHLYDASVTYIDTHDVPMTIDPWKYLLDPEYMIAFRTLPNYSITREYPFASPLRAGGTDRILLLERDD
jgi:4-amino-4-deoxy-L-arabinose transferase-like glycosyltransferase